MNSHDTIDILSTSDDWELKKAAARRLLRGRILESVNISEINSTTDDVTIEFIRQKTILQKLAPGFSGDLESRTFSRREFVTAMEILRT